MDKQNLAENNGQKKNIKKDNKVFVSSIESGKEQVILNVDVPIKTYQLCGCYINGADVWPKGLYVTDVIISISSDNDMPIITIKGYPRPPK